MKIDIDKLERLAKAATPGDWEWDPDDCSFNALQDERSHSVTIAFAQSGINPIIDIEAKDAEFIAACSPDVVLGLIARVREFEELKERLEDHRMEWKLRDE